MNRRQLFGFLAAVPVAIPAAIVSLARPAQPSHWHLPEVEAYIRGDLQKAIARSVVEDVAALSERAQCSLELVSAIYNAWCHRRRSHVVALNLTNTLLEELSRFPKGWMVDIKTVRAWVLCGEPLGFVTRFHEAVLVVSDISFEHGPPRPHELMVMLRTACTGGARLGLARLEEKHNARA